MLVLLAAAAVGSGSGAAANARADLTVKGEVVEIGCSIRRASEADGLKRLNVRTIRVH
jgi:hypothetical protein